MPLFTTLLIILDDTSERLKGRATFPGKAARPTNYPCVICAVRYEFTARGDGGGGGVVVDRSPFRRLRGTRFRACTKREPRPDIYEIPNPP